MGIALWRKGPAGSYRNRQHTPLGRYSKCVSPGSVSPTSLQYIFRYDWKAEAILTFYIGARWWSNPFYSCVPPSPLVLSVCKVKETIESRPWLYENALYVSSILKNLNWYCYNKVYKISQNEPLLVKNILSLMFRSMLNSLAGSCCITLELSTISLMQGDNQQPSWQWGSVNTRTKQEHLSCYCHHIICKKTNKL